MVDDDHSVLIDLTTYFYAASKQHPPSPFIIITQPGS